MRCLCYTADSSEFSHLLRSLVPNAVKKTLLESELL